MPKPAQQQAYAVQTPTLGGTMSRGGASTRGTEGVYLGSNFLRPAGSDPVGDMIVRRVCQAVDAYPELKGAGIVLRLQGQKDFVLRGPAHVSGVDTYVVAEIQGAAAKSWWSHWGDVVISCGGATVSSVGLGFSIAAEGPSLGASTPVTVLAYSATVAGWGQCGLATAQANSERFDEWVKSDDGRSVRYGEVVLDLIALGDGVAGAKELLETSKVLKTSGYANFLQGERKGRLVKDLAQLEKAGKDLTYLNELLGAAIKEKGLGTAGREWSNNVIRRALTVVTTTLEAKRRILVAKAIGDALTAYGTSTSTTGAVNVVVTVMQKTIAEPRPSH